MHESPNQQNTKTPRYPMLRADHPQTPIPIDSGQESWDSLKKKENLFAGWVWKKSGRKKKCFSPGVRSLPRLPTKLNTGTRIGPSEDSWPGKISAGSETQKILVGRSAGKSFLFVFLDFGKSHILPDSSHNRGH